MKTNRQAHEEAAGMGLCPEFFEVSKINPEAPATTTNIEYAMAAYAFVLPRNGEWTFTQWAQAIEEVYDLNVRRHAAVAYELATTPGTIKRQNGETRCEY